MAGRESKFHCNVCSETFPRKRKLKEHMVIHTGEKPFQCFACDKSYTRKDSLARHMNEHHSGIETEEVKDNVCQNCCQEFDTLEELKKHSEVHAPGKPFQCQFCYKHFSAKDKLRYHIVQAEHIKYSVTESGEIETETGDDDMKWYIKRFIYCSPCDLYFESPNLRRRHVSKCHYKGPHQASGETQFKCSRCNLCLANKYTLQKHMRRIHNNDEDSAAKNSAELSKPLHSSEGVLSKQSFCGSTNTIGNGLFNSEYCDDDDNKNGLEMKEKSFTSWSSETHVSIEETPLAGSAKPEDLERDCPNDVDTLASKPDHVLSDDLQFASFSSAENTHDVNHSVVEKEVQKDASTVSQLFERRHSKIFCCRFCPKVFKKQWLLQSHENVHTKPYLCDLCAKPFSNKDILNRHVKLLHSSGDKLLSCEYCGKHFVTGLSLKRHVSGHTGEGIYKCDICGRGFALKTDLKKHQTIHLDTKDFVCEICGKAFKGRDNLRSHLLSHVNEKIRCNVCEKIFKNRYTFSRHMKRHSGKAVLCTVCGKSFQNSSEVKQHMVSHTGERPFKCTYCPKAFSSRGKRKVHERIHTGVKPYKCNVCGKSSTDVANHIKHMKIHDQASKK